jgi:hypothetical protein
MCVCRVRFVIRGRERVSEAAETRDESPRETTRGEGRAGVEFRVRRPGHAACVRIIYMYYMCM